MSVAATSSPEMPPSSLGDDGTLLSILHPAASDWNIIRLRRSLVMTRGAFPLYLGQNSNCSHCLLVSLQGTLTLDSSSNPCHCSLTQYPAAALIRVLALEYIETPPQLEVFPSPFPLPGMLFPFLCVVRFLLNHSNRSWLSLQRGLLWLYSIFFSLW